MIVRELLARLGFQVDGASAANADRTIGRFRQQMGNLGVQAQQTMSTVGRTLAGLGAIFSAQQLGGAIFRTTMETERMMAILGIMEGGVDAAAAKFAELEAFAARTPFSITQNTNAWIRFRGQGLAPVERDLVGLGNVAAVFQSDMDKLAEGITDTVSGSPLILQNLLRTNVDLQSESGRVIFSVMGRTINAERSVQGLMDALIELGHTDFAGAMDAQMNTMLGAWSNLGDAWDTAMRQIGIGGGLNEALRRLFLTLGQILTNTRGLQVGFGELLARGINRLTGAIEFLAEHGAELLEIMRALGGVALSAGITRFGIALAGAVRGALSPARMLTAAILLIPLLIEDVIGFIQGKDSVLGRLLGDNADAVREGLIQLGGPLQEGLGAIIELARELGGLLGDIVKNIFGLNAAPTILDLFGGALSAIVETIKVAVEGVRILREWAGARSRPGGNMSAMQAAREGETAGILSFGFGSSGEGSIAGEEGLQNRLARRQLALTLAGQTPDVMAREAIRQMYAPEAGPRTFQLHVEQSLQFGSAAATPADVAAGAQAGLEAAGPSMDRMLRDAERSAAQ